MITWTVHTRVSAPFVFSETPSASAAVVPFKQITRYLRRTVVRSLHISDYASMLMNVHACLWAFCLFRDKSAFCVCFLFLRFAVFCLRFYEFFVCLFERYKRDGTRPALLEINLIAQREVCTRASFPLVERQNCENFVLAGSFVDEPVENMEVLTLRRQGFRAGSLVNELVRKMEVLM